MGYALHGLIFIKVGTIQYDPNIYHEQGWIDIEHHGRKQKFLFHGTSYINLKTRLRSQVRTCYGFIS